MAAIGKELGVSLRRYPPINGFWVWDIRRDVIYGDTNLAEYFGHSIEEAAAGLPLEVYTRSIVLEDRKRVIEAIEKTKTERAKFREIYQVQSRTVGLRIILAEGGCLYDGEGNPMLLTGFFIDVTDGYETSEVALEACQKLTEQALDAANLGHQRHVAGLLSAALAELQSTQPRTLM